MNKRVQSSAFRVRDLNKKGAMGSVFHTIIRHSSLVARHLMAALILFASLATSQPARADDNKTVKFNFNQARAFIVLDMIKQNFGYVVVNPTDFDKPLTLVTSEPVTIEQALPILMQALEEHGYYVSHNPSQKTLEIFPIKDLDRNKLKWVDLQKIPTLDEGPELYSTMIPLATVDARRLKNILMEKLRLPDWVGLEPDLSGTGIRVVATAAQLKKIVLEAKRADERTSSLLNKTVVRSIQLRYMKSARAFQIIADLFGLKIRVGKSGYQQEDEESGKSKSAGTPPPPDPLGGGGGRGRLGGIPSLDTSPGSVSTKDVSTVDKELMESVSASGTVQGDLIRLYRDDRTNTLIISTTQGLIDTFMEFINQTDVPPAARGDQAALPHIKTYIMNYASVQYTVQALADLFAGTYGIKAEISNLIKQGATAQADAGNQQQQQGQNYPPSRPGGGSNPPSQPYYQQQPSSPSPQGPAPQAQGEAQGVITANIPKKISIIGFLSSNTVSVLGEQPDLEIADALISQIDKMGAQVLIEVAVAEVRLGDAWQFGVSYDLFNVISGKHSYYEHWGERQGTETSMFVKGLNLITPGSSESVSTTVTNDKLTMILNLLQNNSKVNILSVPKVIALNNQPAVIAFQDIGYGFYIEQIQIGTDLQGKPLYKDNFVPFSYSTGLKLAVVPRVNESSQVELNVKLQASEITGSAVDPRIQPPQSQRSVEVISRVDKGDTLLIGGLIKDGKETVVTKIPFLGDLPIIGGLFSNTKNKTSKSELVIILTPHIVTTRGDTKRTMEDQRGKHPNVEWPIPNE